MISTAAPAGNKHSKVGHDPLLEISVNAIIPSPENDRLYRAVDPNSREIKSLAKSMRLLGVLEPIVITKDQYIVSGHRRHAAAKLAGLKTVPCRMLNIRRADDIDAFVRLLREYNRQREKDHAERLREEIVSSDPHQAYQTLIEHREKLSQVSADSFQIVGRKERKSISKAKQPFLDSIIRFVNERQRFWPLTPRQGHYWLLNDPPLRHAGKPDSLYTNDQASYKSLVELLTRARLAGLVPMEAIGDETRPVQIWNVWNSTGEFVGQEIDGFLKNYWRNLMQSQPCHVEIVAEKNTIAPMVNPVAARYCIPTTTGRGYCSLSPRYEMSKRFHRSGKDMLVLIVVSDFDPEGEDIAHSFAQSMRDDFGIERIHPIKAALTADQVVELDLPENNLEAKQTSSRYSKFVEKYGPKVWELEALQPEQLQQLLTDVIDSVIDVDLFNQELEAEEKDAAFLEDVRHQVRNALSGFGGAA